MAGASKALLKLRDEGVVKAVGLGVNEWQVAGIKRAIASFDRGEGIAHKQVEEWVASWGSDKELPAPTRSSR